MRKAFAVLALVALMLIATTTVAFAITNGTPDNGAHPYIGLLVFDDAPGHPAWRCSGTLLTSRVVLTAGHCTDGAVAARLWVDDVVQGNPEYPFSGSTSYDGTPYTNPNFCIGCGGGLPGFGFRDVGVVVLSEAVPKKAVSSYGALPSAGLVDTLANKTNIDSVGYGVQDRVVGHGQPVMVGVKVRMWGLSELVSGEFVHSDEYLRLTANPSGDSGGTCFGDSGGPNLLGGTNVVLGINSYVTNGNCTGVTYSQRADLPVVLSWVRSFLH